MLRSIPTEKHLSRAYFELARIGAGCVGQKNAWPYKTASKEELFALVCDMSRYDPRLLEIIIVFFRNRWSKFDPLRLRMFYPHMKCPQTIAVVCEFMRADRGTEQEYFVNYLLKGMRPVPCQFYFFDLYVPGGGLARRATDEGLYEFKKWGFLASERPIVRQIDKLSAGSFDAQSRKNILKRILAENGILTIGSYLEAVHFSISRQQALKDLAGSGMVKCKGRGRSASWIALGS